MLARVCIEGPEGAEPMQHCNGLPWQLMRLLTSSLPFRPTAEPLNNPIAQVDLGRARATVETPGVTPSGTPKNSTMGGASLRASPAVTPTNMSR